MLNYIETYKIQWLDNEFLKENLDQISAVQVYDFAARKYQSSIFGYELYKINKKEIDEMSYLYKYERKLKFVQDEIADGIYDIKFAGLYKEKWINCGGNQIIVLTISEEGRPQFRRI
jgi:hypothetical protein